MFGYTTATLKWPSTTGYITYTGGFPDTDDEAANVSIGIPSFAMNGTVYNELWFSTNGSVTFDTGTTAYEGYPSELTQICANNDDMELDPGNITLNDGTVHNIYYKSGSGWTKIICNQGYHDDVNKVGSWYLGIYRDDNFQWIDTRLKVSNTNLISGGPLNGEHMQSGPYNEPNADVYQPVTTIGRVWRGDLNGESWTYMGYGSVYGAVEEVFTTCGNQGCGQLTGKVCRLNDDSCTCAQWKYYTAQCTRIQQALGICSGMSGAYVPAITICNQRLF